MQPSVARWRLADLTGGLANWLTKVRPARAASSRHEDEGDGTSPTVSTPATDAAPSGASPPTRERMHDIDRAKGLGIFLVVLGHLVTGRQPEGGDWYVTLRAVIYGFHMPFFIYLSGFMFFYTGSHLVQGARTPSFIAKRAERLLVPFLAFGVIIVLGKHLAANFIHVDNYSSNIVSDLVNLIWNTRSSAAQSIWYVFVLFEYTVIVLLLHKLIKNLWVLIAIATPISALFVPSFLYMDRFVLYLPFFLSAGIAVQMGARWLAFIDRYLWLNLALFAGAIIVARVIGDYHLTILLCGFLSIPALHGVCRRKFSETGGVLAFLGAFSFSIYLLNTITIGLAKGIALTFLAWDGPGFRLMFLILLAAGLVGPILIKVLIFRRIPYVDKITS